MLGEAAIIPFKARAWLDLTRQREEGGNVDEKNIRKHFEKVIIGIIFISVLPIVVEYLRGRRKA